MNYTLLHMQGTPYPLTALRIVNAVDLGRKVLGSIKYADHK